MKIFLTICFLIFNLSADGFKYFININSNMTHTEITDAIQNAQDGTVVKFSEGTYTFKLNKPVEFKNKKFITLKAIENSKVIIENLVLKSHVGSSDIYIMNLELKNSILKFISTKNIFLSKIKLNKTQLSFFKNSNAKIENIESNTDYKYPVVFSEESSLTIKNIHINNQLNNSIQLSKKSILKITGSYFSNPLTKSIDCMNSSLHLEKNNFTNKIFKNYENATIIKSSVFLKQCNILAKENIFKKFGNAIFISEGTIAKILKNTFEETEKSIILYDKSSAIIEGNTFLNAVGLDTYAILIRHKSTANILKNEFTNLWNAVIVDEASKVNIIENTTGNFKRGYNLFMDDEIFDREGKPFDIRDGCEANIKNNAEINRINCDDSLIAENAKVYKLDNEQDFDAPGLLNSQVADKERFIDVLASKHFKEINIKDIKIAEIDYASLQKSKIEYVMQKKVHSKSGLLVDELIFTFNEDITILSKNTQIKLNVDNNSILEPLEYKGVELETLPKLKSEIIIEPKIKKKSSNKYRLYFSIKANVLITSIKLKNIKLTFPKSTYEFDTQAMSIRSKNFHEVYELVLFGKDDGIKFDKRYECQVINPNKVNCIAKIKNSI